MLTLDQLAAIAGRPPNGNMRSFHLGHLRFGPSAEIDRPHRIAQYVPQACHESGAFRFDRELWDGRGAQARYDTRTDLGNTPERDGDGYRNRGRGPFQVTGAFNIAAFEDWARRADPGAPDFTRDPDLINTDPWEGASAVWYWSARALNAYADRGDVEGVTKRINGGLNGYADRCRFYARAALVLLGYGPEEVRRFQGDHGLLADDDPGPLTRRAMHADLAAMSFAPPVAPPPALPPASAEARIARIRAICEEPA